MSKFFLGRNPFFPFFLSISPERIGPLHSKILNQHVRTLHISPILRDEELPKFKPRRFFDLKKFKEYLKRHKQFEEEEEKKQIARAYAKPAPEGWTVKSFLSRCGIKENLDDVAEAFPSWEDLMTATSEKLAGIEALQTRQRRELRRKLNLFNHGLWPNGGQKKLMENFQAPPLANEGKPWTEEDDRKLLQLAEEYDMNFGDPWLYLTWELQREFPDVYNRYVDLKVKPECLSKTCELAVTRSSRPLLMNRSFKLFPPRVYIVPSERHHCLPSSARFSLPEKFVSYRREECFHTSLDDEVTPKAYQFDYEGTETATYFTSATTLIETEAIGNAASSAAGLSLGTEGSAVQSAIYQSKPEEGAKVIREMDNTNVGQFAPEPKTTPKIPTRRGIEVELPHQRRTPVKAAELCRL